MRVLYITDNQIDLCFVIDRSQSIGADNWKLLLNFVENIVNKLTISNNDTRFALVTFASFGELVFGLDVFNNNTSGLIEAIRSADYYGYGTSIDNGLYTARTECFYKVYIYIYIYIYILYIYNY
ncbi:hypothetical protein LSH36_38g01066 [Paralvinella palmiformis]|uniref:VWFA domain-containing protein n=1 Tax=Paralvinella palmiformis TaxID=53620 RepID=A0AAD9K7I5_9ANNE|nr:hypothetical protein LSH36_38g01066 [Paralvinella palmiformis]